MRLHPGNLAGLQDPLVLSSGPVVCPTYSFGARLRRYLRSCWPEWASIALYAGLLVCAIPFHEPWADEAQAWQIARNVSLYDLFHTYIRCEATPGLWHFLLWCSNRVNISYTGMHWICGLIALVGTAVLVLMSPFPRYLKLSFPFTFFLLFQYAIVARSYVIVPLMLFLTAAVWRKNTALLMLVLGVLANVSLHASVISGGFVIVYFYEKFQGGEFKSPSRRRALLLGALLLLALYAFALWTTWPSHDIPISYFREEHRPILVYTLGTLLQPIYQPMPLSILFWIALGQCLYFRKSVRYFLPILFFIGFSGLVYSRFHHMGMIVPLVLSILWITWPYAGSGGKLYENICNGALIYLVVVHILWSGYSFHFDHYHAFSPDQATAEFLKPYVHAGASIIVGTDSSQPGQTYFAVGILPYFDRNIYRNLQVPFWWFSTLNDTKRLYDADLPSHPNIVLLEINDPKQPVIASYPEAQKLTKLGYRFTNMFCGSMPARIEIPRTDCHLVFISNDFLLNFPLAVSADNLSTEADK